MYININQSNGLKWYKNKFCIKNVNNFIFILKFVFIRIHTLKQLKHRNMTLELWYIQ